MKFTELQAQYQAQQTSYIKYLANPGMVLTESQAYKMAKEIARLQQVIERIERMPYSKAKEVVATWKIEIPLKLPQGRPKKPFNNKPQHIPYTFSK